MDNGPELASGNAGQILHLLERCLGLDSAQGGQVGLAGGASIPQLPALCLADHGHRLLAEWIVGVISYLEDPVRAGSDTGAAAIALIGIDGDEILAGAILISIVGKFSNHGKLGKYKDAKGSISRYRRVFPSFRSDLRIDF